jgi:polar amino acid transport system permease protein
VRDTSTVARSGAGDSRPSVLPEDDHGFAGRRGLFLTLAAWVFLAEGIHALVRTLEDVMDAGPSWPLWAYAATAALSFAAGAILFTTFLWAYYAAAAAAVVAGFLIFPPLVGGFAVFGVIELGLLALGWRGAGNSEAMQLASANIPWRAKLLTVQAGIAVVLIRVFIALELDVPWMVDHWWNIVSKGLLLTVSLSSLAIILAIVLALFGALGRLSRNPVAFGLAGFYTSFFRGTPLIVQIFLFYFGLAEIGVRMRGTPLQALGAIITMTPFVAGVVAIGLNYGAYMTEIFRAGIQSVGHGQAEAADALGMTYGLRMRRIVLPQAVRVIIPPTGNEFIAMTKDTALVSIIGVLELFRRADLAGRADFRTFEAFIIAATVYWVFTAVLTVFQTRLERRMAKGYVRTGEAGTKPTARKRSFLPAPSGQRRLTFLPGHGGGQGGGAGGIIFTTDDEGNTSSYGIDGTSSPGDREPPR